MKRLRGLRIGTRLMRPRLIALATALLAVSVLGVGTALGKADTETVHKTTPFSGTIHVPCAAGGAGEDVGLTGTIREISHVTQNPRHTQAKEHVGLQGSGVGLTTGDKYRLVSIENLQLSVADGGATAATIVLNIKLIGQGPGNNLAEQLTLHLTENANGELTAEVDNVKVECM